MSLHMRLKAEQNAREAKREIDQAERDEKRYQREAKMAMRFGKLNEATILEGQANDARVRANAARNREKVALAEAEAWKHDDPAAFRATMNKHLSPAHNSSAFAQTASEAHVSHQYSSSGGCASTGFSIGANMPQPCASSPAHTNFHALAPSACPSAPCGFTQPQTAPYPAATNLPYPSNQAPSFTASNPTLNSASSIQIGHAPGYPSEAFQGYQSVSIQPPTFSADIAFPGFPNFSMKF